MKSEKFHVSLEVVGSRDSAAVRAAPAAASRTIIPEASSMGAGWKEQSKRRGGRSTNGA